MGFQNEAHRPQVQQGCTSTLCGSPEYQNCHQPADWSLLPSLPLVCLSHCHWMEHSDMSLSAVQNPEPGVRPLIWTPFNIQFSSPANSHGAPLSLFVYFGIRPQSHHAVVPHPDQQPCLPNKLSMSPALLPPWSFLEYRFCRSTSAKRLCLSSSSGPDSCPCSCSLNLL